MALPSRRVRVILNPTVSRLQDLDILLIYLDLSIRLSLIKKKLD